MRDHGVRPFCARYWLIRLNSGVREFWATAVVFAGDGFGAGAGEGAGCGRCCDGSSDAIRLDDIDDRASVLV